MLARLHQAMCRRGIAERERAVDDRFDRARVEQRPHIAPQRRGNLALFRRAAGPQRRARDRQPAAEDAPEVERRGIATHEADDDEPAFDREGDKIARDVVAADDVEDEVDAAAAGHLLDDGDEVFGPVVDTSLRTELLAGAALLV